MMGKRGFGSKRRTVVQLEDEPRRQPTFGFGYKPTDDQSEHVKSNVNALSGLMSNYAHDSDDEPDDEDDVEEEEAGRSSNVDSSAGNSKKSAWPKFVPATDPILHPKADEPDDNAGASKNHSNAAVVSKVAKNHSTVAGSSGKNEATAGGSASGVEIQKKDDMDLQLMDFLAEIESIDKQVDNQEAIASEDIDGTPLDVIIPKKDVIPVPQKSEISDENETGSSDDDSSPPVEPTPPATVWQHCLDEGTQCYYYWNMETNAVTWDIPTEFSQYLLRYKHYEESLVKYEKEMAEWKKKSKRQKKSTKKHRSHKKKLEGVAEIIEPLVSYPPEDDENSDQVETPIKVFGPQKPPEPKEPKLDKPSGDKKNKEGVRQEIENGVDKGDDGLSHTTLKALHDKFTKKIQETKLQGGQADKKQKKSKDTEDVKCSSGESKNKQTDAKEKEKTAEKSKPTSSKVRSQKAGSSSKEEPATCKRREEVGSAAADSTKMLVEENLLVEDDEEFVQRELEEPLITHYEYVNKKYTGDDLELETKSCSSDDINLQLELALERKQLGEMGGKLGEMGGKRKADDSHKDENITTSKRTRMEPELSDSRSLPARTNGGAAAFKLNKDDIKDKVNALAEVVDLATNVTDKLDFLDINRSGLTKLQVLLVSLETRIEDWKEGGLSTEHLLRKLKETDAIVQQYELTATPPGWSCFWDRSFKRYFYRHLETGEIRWEYPNVVVAENAKKSTSNDKSRTREDYNVGPYMTSESRNSGDDVTSGDGLRGAATIMMPDNGYETSAFQAYTIPSPNFTQNPFQFNDQPLYPSNVIPPLPGDNDLMSLVANPPPPPPSIPPPPASPPPQTPPEHIMPDSHSPLNSPQEAVGTSVDEHLSEAEMELDDDAINEEAYNLIENSVDAYGRGNDAEAAEESTFIADELETVGNYDAREAAETEFPVESDRVVDSTYALESTYAHESTYALESSSVFESTSVFDPTSTEDLNQPMIEDNGAALSCAVTAEVSSGTEGSHVEHATKEKKKKKEKSLVAGGLGLKKKNVSSLVEKWQKVQDDVNREVEKELSKQKKLVELARKGPPPNE